MHHLSETPLEDDFVWFVPTRAVTEISTTVATDDDVVAAWLFDRDREKDLADDMASADRRELELLASAICDDEDVLPSEMFSVGWLVCEAYRYRGIGFATGTLDLLLIDYD